MKIGPVRRHTATDQHPRQLPKTVMGGPELYLETEGLDNYPLVITSLQPRPRIAVDNDNGRVRRRPNHPKTVLFPPIRC